MLSSCAETERQSEKRIASTVKRQPTCLYLYFIRIAVPPPVLQNSIMFCRFRIGCNLFEKRGGAQEFLFGT